jgi:hypothetical protein
MNLHCQFWGEIQRDGNWIFEGPSGAKLIFLIIILYRSHCLCKNWLNKLNDAWKWNSKVNLKI